MNNLLNVKITKLAKHAVIPKYAKPGDAAMDLYAVDGAYDPENDYIEYGTGLAVEIPEGFVGLIFPRSSISKTPLLQANAVGVVDSGYRGELCVRFKRIREGREHQEYQAGDRIGQFMIVPYPKVEFEEVEQLSKTERGTGGFGSSGK